MYFSEDEPVTLVVSLRLRDPREKDPARLLPVNASLGFPGLEGLEEGRRSSLPLPLPGMEPVR